MIGKVGSLVGCAAAHAEVAAPEHGAVARAQTV